jgi:hypothetical protein
MTPFILYMIIGTIAAAIVETSAAASGSKVRLKHFERFFFILLWPIYFTIFLYHFFKGNNE